MIAPGPIHPRIWELLPWVANGRASDAQIGEVEAHLVDCPDCCDELVLQRALHASMNAEPVSGDPHNGFARLLARIEASPDDAGSVAREGIHHEAAQSPRRLPVALRAAVVALLMVQSVALVVMGSRLATRSDATPAVDGEYRTLSRPEVAAMPATIRFVPAPELTVQAMQAMFDEAGVRIVEGRPRAAIYGLAPIVDDIDGDASAAAIERLRSKAGVLLVEPLAPPR